SYVDGTLTINKAPLTVTADDKTATYDGAVDDDGPAVHYTGFVGGEDESVLGGSVAFGGTSQTAKDVGTYTITASGLTSNNYEIKIGRASWREREAPLTVAGDEKEETEDGAVMGDEVTE